MKKILVVLLFGISLIAQAQFDKAHFIQVINEIGELKEDTLQQTNIGFNFWEGETYKYEFYNQAYTVVLKTMGFEVSFTNKKGITTYSHFYPYESIRHYKYNKGMIVLYL